MSTNGDTSDPVFPLFILYGASSLPELLLWSLAMTVLEPLPGSSTTEMMFVLALAVRRRSTAAADPAEVVGRKLGYPCAAVGSS